MNRWIGRVALVTGASRGIGAAICKELVKQRLTVIGCARSVTRIHDLAEEVADSPGTLHAIKCDLTNESQILDMFKDIRRKFGRIDICINNGGFNTKSPLLSGITEDWRRIFEVNILGLCICTREAVKLMTEKQIDEGQIINLSSIAAHKYPDTNEGGAGLNFYCGTKFMVRALTEGVRQEVKSKSTHIRVSNLSPGLVKTDLFNRTLDAEMVERLFNTFSYLEPQDIADAVVSILTAPAHVDVNDIIVQAVEKKTC